MPYPPALTLLYLMMFNKVIPYQSKSDEVWMPIGLEVL